MSTAWDVWRSDPHLECESPGRCTKGLIVSEKQKDRARQVFERSAEQGGFFEHGKNRLVMPAVAVREPPPVVDPPKDKHAAEAEAVTMA